MPMFNPQGKTLGILKPVGGGDPIPLNKVEVIIGRRRSCDVCLDFNNISGKHCQLRLINSVWHVRDLGSTNGTSLNGMPLASEHSVMPDDELGIASHLFTIDYEPRGPDAVLAAHGVGEEGTEEGHGRRTSLLELAGIEDEDERPRHRRASAVASSASSSGMTPAPATGPGQSAIRRPATSEPDFKQEEIPADFQAGAAPLANADDDDFLKLIEEDVKKAGDKRENRR
jgi:hypothetical protein